MGTFTVGAAYCFEYKEAELEIEDRSRSDGGPYTGI